jgi:hypothetical protein
MAASNTRFTQNSLGQSKTPIDSDHGIYRYTTLFAALHDFFLGRLLPRCRLKLRKPASTAAAVPGPIATL